jgi:protein-tyrosine phosphatase
MIDLHAHILPNLDDGASSWDQSLAMARTAAEDGITAMVCTPHWVPGKYENSRSIVLDRIAEMKLRLEQAGIALALHPGAELRLDVTLPERIAAGDLLTLNDSGIYALIELPEETLPKSLERFFWQLEMRRIKPIISHVERNAVLRRDPQRLFEWVERGILTQLTMASLVGEFSEEIKIFAMRLLEHRLAHMLVTDAHGMRTRRPLLSEGCEIIARTFGNGMAEQMTRTIPQCILDGKSFFTADPLPLKKPSSSFFSFKGLFSRK